MSIDRNSIERSNCSSAIARMGHMAAQENLLQWQTTWLRTKGSTCERGFEVNNHVGWAVRECADYGLWNAGGKNRLHQPLPMMHCFNECPTHRSQLSLKAAPFPATTPTLHRCHRARSAR